MEFIDLKAQYKQLKNKIDERIQNVLDHGQYIMGPEVHELEEKLADYVGVKHAITCANGTDALQLALMAMEIGSGDAILCPTFTFFASAEAVSFVGAIPIFVDSDETTFNICPIDLEKRIIAAKEQGKCKLKAIMAVDLFGLPANYPEIQKIADKYELMIIEDAAQGFGGTINGQKAGTFGDIATTSFFPAKPLGCYGDGGAIFTNNDEYATLIKSLRIHGKGSDKYDNIRIGMNSRLDTIQAAVLLEKLRVFPTELEARNRLAKFYSDALRGMKDISVPLIPKGYKSSWAQYTLKSNNRTQYISTAKSVGVPLVIYYERCMHQQTAFSKIQMDNSIFPKAEKLCREVFSIPIHPYLDQVAQEKVMNALES